MSGGKYYIIAGEASGDLHGGNLIRAIKKMDADANIRCWGGNNMEAAGGKLVKHYSDLAFMGFVEVLMNLRTIFRNLDFCKKDIVAYQPDVLVLIDYPGFNLRMAKWAKQQGIKVVYYISPQVWAWKENRVKMMKRCIDKMIVILPFEKEYYQDKWQWNVAYVGHPLLQEIHSKMAAGAEPLRSTNNVALCKPIIALLPGSRRQEIKKKLPVMLEVSASFPDYQFVVAQAPGLESAFYHQFIAGYANMALVQNQTYDLLMQSKAALVTSGTATLETALFGVPEVVCYKGAAISYQIAKRVINIKYISLVNLIMDKEVVKELIQGEMNAANITTELNALLSDEEKIKTIQNDYNRLKQLLNAEGNPSEKAAKMIVELTYC
jgi:lipid-A-disaccharide synthase